MAPGRSTMDGPQGGPMKFSKIAVAALVALPAIVLAQAAPTQAKPDMKATFSVMKENVAKITLPSEKIRWEANKDAWEVEVAANGKLQPVDLGKVTAALDKIKDNVSKIRAGGEKERWQANIDLWQLLVSHQGVLGKADLATAAECLKTIKSNVADITSATEKERWQANRDLWQVMLDRAGTK